MIGAIFKSLGSFIGKAFTSSVRFIAKGGKKLTKFGKWSKTKLRKWGVDTNPDSTTEQNIPPEDKKSPKSNPLVKLNKMEPEDAKDSISRDTGLSEEESRYLFTHSSVSDYRDELSDIDRSDEKANEILRNKPKYEGFFDENNQTISIPSKEVDDKYLNPEYVDYEEVNDKGEVISTHVEPKPELTPIKYDKNEGSLRALSEYKDKEDLYYLTKDLIFKSLLIRILKTGTTNQFLIKLLAKHLTNEVGLLADKLNKPEESVEGSSETQPLAETDAQSNTEESTQTELKENAKVQNKLISWIGNKVSNLGSAVIGGVLSPFKKLFNVLSGINPMEWVMLILMGVAKFIKPIKTLINDLGMKLETLWTNLGKWFDKIWLFLNKEIFQRFSDWYEVHIKGATKEITPEGNTKLTYEDGSFKLRSKDGNTEQTYNKDGKLTKLRRITDGLTVEYDNEGKVKSSKLKGVEVEVDSKGNVKGAKVKDGWTVSGVGLHSKTESIDPTEPLPNEPKSRTIKTVGRYLDYGYAKVPYNGGPVPKGAKLSYGPYTYNESIKYFIYRNYVKNYSVRAYSNEKGDLVAIPNSYRSDVGRADEEGFWSAAGKRLSVITSSPEGAGRAFLTGVGNLGRAVGIDNQLGRVNIGDKAASEAVANMNSVTKELSKFTADASGKVLVAMRDSNGNIDADATIRAGMEASATIGSYDNPDGLYSKLDDSNLFADSYPATFGTKKPPIAIRDNNPGNIVWSSKNKWDGQLGKDTVKGSDGKTRSFVVFDSMASGYRALFKNIRAQYNKGHRTIADLIKVWAPASDSNNPKSYANQVAKYLGLTPKSVIDLNNRDTMMALAGSIFRIESGHKPVLKDIKAGWDLYSKGSTKIESSDMSYQGNQTWSEAFNTGFISAAPTETKAVEIKPDYIKPKGDYYSDFNGQYLKLDRDPTDPSNKGKYIYVKDGINFKLVGSPFTSLSDPNAEFIVDSKTGLYKRVTAKKLSNDKKSVNKGPVIKTSEVESTPVASAHSSKINLSNKAEEIKIDYSENEKSNPNKSLEDKLDKQNDAIKGMTELVALNSTKASTTVINAPKSPDVIAFVIDPLLDVTKNNQV